MPSFEQEKEVKRYPKHFPGLRETLAPSVETRQIVAYRTVERFHPMGLRLDRFIVKPTLVETPPFRAVGADPCLKAGVSGDRFGGGERNPFQNTLDRQA
ncbi:MAG: hypothetical protein LBJ59_05170 [Zoogloeaceae bacterium]|jgi:hypothetical protein|nr:hypothetical protein [Zoogloeaceae bacterium]